MHTYIRIYMHACMHACMHTNMHTHAYIHTYTCGAVQGRVDVRGGDRILSLVPREAQSQEERKGGTGKKEGEEASFDCGRYCERYRYGQATGYRYGQAPRQTLPKAMIKKWAGSKSTPRVSTAEPVPLSLAPPLPLPPLPPSLPLPPGPDCACLLSRVDRPVMTRTGLAGDVVRLVW
jgi:hypothetical protein